MKAPRILPHFLITMIILCISAPLMSEVTVEPLGIMVAPERDDSLVVEVTLANDGDADIAYSISLVNPPDEDALNIPRRDEFGDRIAFYDLPNRGWCGLAWNDGEIMAADWDNQHMYIWDFEEEDFIEDFEVDYNCWSVAYDGEAYWVSADGPNRIRRIDREGDVLATINLNWTPAGVAWDGDNLWVSQYGGEAILQQMRVDGEVLREFDCGDIEGNGSLTLTWVPEHPDNPLWTVTERGILHQLELDMDEETIDVVQSFDMEFNAQSVYGLTHDGENLWYSTYVEVNNEWGWGVVDDGIAELRWLTVDSEAGIVGADDSEVLSFVVQPGEFEAGIYEKRILVELSEAEERRDEQVPGIIEFSAVMSLESTVAKVAGEITDAATNESIVGAMIELDEYIVARFSDEDGLYRIDNLPLGEYELLFEAVDFLPHREELVIDDNDEVDLDVALLHSECNPDPDSIETLLESGESEEFEINITNDGNGPLSYTIEKRLPGEADLNPWELRLSLEIAEEVDDDRLGGAIYTRNRFYVTGGENDTNWVYVLDMEGNEQRRFEQLGDARWGMQDLAWDGENIWGASESTIYAFTTNGDSAAGFGGVPRATRALAWDPDRDYLWTGGVVGDIIAFNEAGDERAELNRRGLSVYGLAYLPGDDHPLYILHRSQEGIASIYKMNPENGDTAFVVDLPVDDGGEPSSGFITAEFDVYSNVFVGLSDVSANEGGDRIDVWQIQGYDGWMQIEPDEGVIEADESEMFTLTLDATDLSDTTFEGQIVWIHDGVGGETVVDITLQIGDLPDLPSPFGLLQPANWDTVRTTEIIFTWEQSIDPDPEDSVSYQMYLRLDNDTIIVNSPDAEKAISLDTLDLEIMTESVVEWWVLAVSGEDSVECDVRFEFWVRRPPSVFSLVQPADEDTVLGVEQTFKWEPAIDPDPGDIVNYRLWFQQQDNSISFESPDTVLTLSVDTLEIPMDFWSQVVWWVVAVSVDDEVESSSRFTLSWQTEFVDDFAVQPSEFALHGVFPNPFNSTTRIRFDLPVSTTAALRIYDLSGRQVGVLFNEDFQAGRYSATWDASDLSNGTYFIRLVTPQATRVQKVVLMK